MSEFCDKIFVKGKINKNSKIFNELNKQFEIRCKSLKIINSLNKKGIFDILKEESNLKNIENFFTEDNIKLYFSRNDKVYGFYDTKNNTIYMNIVYVLSNPKEFVKTVIHEKLHKYTNNEIVAKNNTNFAIETHEFFSKINKINVQQWLLKQLLDDDNRNILLTNTIDAMNVMNQHRNNRVIFIHGTFSDGTTFKDDFIASTLDMLKDYNFDILNWSGKNTKQSRTDGAKELLKLVNDYYQYNKDEIINLVGHSHGGNVIKEFTNIYDGDHKIRVLNYATPNRKDYRIKNDKIVEFYNIYHKDDDLIQGFVGGFDFWDIPVKSNKKTNESNVINVMVEDSLKSNSKINKFFKNYYSIHTNIHSKKTNDSFVRNLF